MDYNGSTTHEAHKALQDVSQYSSIESGLTLVGLAGLQDPPRPEVKGAIADCGLAGVRVIVITGVHSLKFFSLFACNALHDSEIQYVIQCPQTRWNRCCLPVCFT